MPRGKMDRSGISRRLHQRIKFHHMRRLSIPEPSSAILLILGSGGLVFYRRSKRRKRESFVL
ncbi:MAG: hypothetical protein DRP64_12385 [Verrucomicrobia bacterium]|nr:MAG: hypothetical protein DRP64_12385 [Verrucomicrobiota bacterium]